MEAQSLTDNQWDQYQALLAQLQRLSVEERAKALRILSEERQVDPLVLARVDWHLRRRSDPDQYPPGTRVGDCTLEEEIGAGGMGVVYRAQQHIVSTSSPVAVKLIHPTLLQTNRDQALARFLDELGKLATLRRRAHEGIAMIYTGGIHTDPRTQAKLPYIVMELVHHGQPLTTYARACNLPLVKRLALFLQVCIAVRHAHEHEIVHRDLKPANILVNSDERPVVIDFGLAQAYDAIVPGASLVSGTPAYMSPEQVDRTFGPIGVKSDVYALGVILYELLTGHHPYEGPLQSAPAQWRQIITQEEPPPFRQYHVTYQVDVEAITTAALAKRPQARLTLDELKGRIQHCLGDLARESERWNLSKIRNQHHRRKMLEKVRRTWITEVLEPSLNQLARIELGLETKPDATDRPYDRAVQRPVQAPQLLPTGTPISHIFDDADNGLLILGEPGAGKTTLLLELTRDLLDRAQRDARCPIPVVFHLSEWSEWAKQPKQRLALTKRLALTDWLIYELKREYKVPRKLAKKWVKDDYILPLLDGLDEVATDHQEACVETLHDFLSEHGLSPLVVCSRVADYKALTGRLRLLSAVHIQLLSRQQVQHYVAQAGAPLAGLCTALQNDEHLWELLNTPLMLSIAALAYQGCAAEAISSSGTVAERRTQLFAAYTDAMFQRRAEATPYPRAQIEHWLTWLARAMKDHDQSIFYLERIQPDWLPGRRQQRLVTLLTSVMNGLFGGLVFGLVFGLLGWLGGGLRGGLVLGLVFGLGGGLYFGLFGRLSVVTGNPFGGGLGGRLFYRLRGRLGGGLLGDAKKIKPVEKLRWSWSAARQEGMKRLKAGLRYGLGGGLVFGLLAVPIYVLYGPHDEQMPERGAGLLLILLLMWLGCGFAGLVAGLVCGLLAGLEGGLRSGFIVEEVETKPEDSEAFVALLKRSGFMVEEVETKSFPNEGISRSLRNAIKGGLLFGLFGGLLFGLSIGYQELRSGSDAWLGIGVVAGLVSGLFSGLNAGLCFGGHAFLHHYALRLVLWRNNFAPLNYVDFLDYAAARIFLRKVGGGYIFIHRMLLEYFAARHHISPEQQNRDRRCHACGSEQLE
jgi:serine/threonine protein kinase